MENQKIIIFAKSPVLSLISEILGIENNTVRLGVFIEDIISIAKKLTYDISGKTNTADEILNIINEYNPSPYVYKEVLTLTSNYLNELLSLLVLYDIVNDNIYVVDVTPTQIVLNTYTFFIDVNSRVLGDSKIPHEII